MWFTFSWQFWSSSSCCSPVLWICPCAPSRRPPRCWSGPPCCQWSCPWKVFFNKKYFYTIIFYYHLVTLCWAVKAQGQGHRRDSVARCEQSRRSSGITLESMRRSEMFFHFLLFFHHSFRISWSESQRLEKEEDWLTGLIASSRCLSPLLASLQFAQCRTSINNVYDLFK